MASKDEFVSVFPDIIRDLTEDGSYSDIPEVTKRFAKVLEYNVLKGKKLRGLAVVACYKILESVEKLTPENIRLANILGWCVEMFQGASLILDDIIDVSETRHELPCWYRNKEVGLQAVNDGMMVENAIYFILRKYFRNHPSYVALLDLFHEIAYKSCMGQIMDCMKLNNETTLDSYTMARYNSITKYKTAYYSIYLPVRLAMILAGQFDEEVHRQSKPILIELGQFFQAQNDFWDCFGDVGLFDKSRTDIREGKCCWPIVVALERATPQQTQILHNHYGAVSDESEQIVRALYDELDLHITTHKHDSHFRPLSTVKANAFPETPSMASQDEFMSVFSDIVRDLTEDDCYSDMPEVTKRLAKVLQYNVPNGKKFRGLTVVASYKILESVENLTPENIRLANILGWCIEMLQGAFLIVDDIMDVSEMRHGLPCWYRNKEVGLQAVNDGMMVENAMYFILRKYFWNHPSYVAILDLFHEMTLKSSLGQTMDCMKLNTETTIDTYDMTRYNSIVKYKTSYYTCYLPVRLAMILAGLFDEVIHRQAKTILLELGHYFQVQNDYVDCFGDFGVLGKSCTDIREGKCCWPIVVALEKATPQQTQVIYKHYGVETDESEKIILALYEDVDLPKSYAIYKENSLKKIIKLIQEISKQQLQEVFFKLMETTKTLIKNV